MPDMLDEAVQDYITSAKSWTVAGFATTPDDAARSIQLEEATGTPAPLISPDVQSYDKDTQRDMASTIVEHDPQLMAYVHSHPMAASVSQNDWGNLSLLSQTAAPHAAQVRLFNAPWDQGFDAALTAAREDLNRPITQYSYKDIAEKFPALDPSKPPLGMLSNFLATTGFNAASVGLEGTSNLVSAAIHGGTAFAGAFAKAVGIPDPEGFARAVGTELERRTTEPTHAIGAAEHAPDMAAVAQTESVVRSFTGALQRWNVAGKELPAGNLPVVDMVKAQHNTQMLDGLDEVVKLAQSSETKDLAPTLLRNFMEQHYGQSRIGISGDAAIGLYGDKLPEPNDGLLGWVPGIADKLDLARRTGADVEVPIADWVARVDPGIAKALHDDLRAWPGGVTAREMGDLIVQPPKMMVDEALPQVRAVTGMEPVFAPGDRKVLLANPDMAGDMHGFDLVNEKGENIGGVVLTPQGKNLEIENINGVAGIWSNSLGPAVIRDLLRQLQQYYPEAETVSGYRVTGARPEPTRTVVKLSGMPKEAEKLIGEAPPTATEVTAPATVPAVMENLKASGIGLDVKTFSNLQKLVHDRYMRDLDQAQVKAEREQKQRQGAEWKENRKAMREDVEQAMLQRQDIKVDQFLGMGQVDGKQLPQKRYSLLESDLTAEQKAMLPPSYYSKSGFPVDEVAKQFGYPSGETMINALGGYNAAKAGRGAKEMLEHTIDVETDRQMEAKYGDLPTNILSEAKDQAFADAELHLVTEEYIAAAQMAGVQAVDRATIAAAARDSVNRMQFSELNSDKFTQLVKKAQDIAIRALTNGDPTLAVQALQRRTENAHIAAEIMKVEKQVPKFQRLTKFYAKPWDVTKPSPVEPTWSLFTRNMLSKVGLPYGMSVQGMVQRLAGQSRYHDLAEFVTKTENENEVSGLQLPVPDWLLRNDPQQKPFKALTVEEWKDVNQSLVTFDKLGRDEQKAVTADEKVDKAELIGKMRKQLAEYFEPIPKDLEAKGEWRQAIGHFIAASTSNETLMSRFDHRDTHGIFTETFSKPAASAANAAAVMERETGKALRELGPVKDGERTISSPFMNPKTQQPVKNFTRNNLAVVISNMGNDYNWKVLTKGYKIDPDVAWKWVESVSTPEMLERAQDIGRIFKGLWKESSAMYERLYGMAPEAVEPRPFMMHGKEWEGWYHPIIGDTELSRYVNKLPELDKAETNYWPSTNNAYTKRRTGAIQVLDLSYDQIGVRLSQEIHDIAFREFVSNAAKLIKDQSFRQGVTSHYGKEYLDQMDGWIQRVAGKNSFNGAAMRLAQRWSNELRQNVISTYVAFNPITAMKHGSTAWMMSSRELDQNIFKSIPKFVGFTGQLLANRWFGSAVSDLYGKSPVLGDNLWHSAISISEELQRRQRNWQDTIGGAQTLNAYERSPGHWAVGGPGLRDRIAQTGASVVAFSDLLSAVPLWIAKYREEFARSAEHGTAVREADLAVRRAHGSTAITNLPAIATSQDVLGPWMTSLYGFMGTNMQRRIEIFHDFNDAYHLGMEGEIRKASRYLPTILSSVAVYGVWTGIVEEIASQQFFADHRSLGEKTLAWLFGTVAQTTIGVRDLVYDLTTGKEDAGLISTPMHDMSNLIRDARKADPLSKAHIGKFVSDGCNTLGDLKELCPKHVGNAMRYGIDTFNGYQIPHSGWDVEKGLITGTQKQKIVR